jgi:hypothetical protein
MQRRPHRALADRFEHHIPAPRPRTPTDPIVVETVRTILTEMGLKSG